MENRIQEMVRGHNNSYARLIRGKRRDRTRKKEDRTWKGHYKRICARDDMGENNVENN